VRSKFKKTIVVNALLFIAGFSAVFVSFGASASFIGQVLIGLSRSHSTDRRDPDRHLRPLFIGIVNINFLKMEHRFQSE